MMTTAEIIRFASAEGFTKEHAKDIVHRQVHEMLSVLTDMDEEEATKRVLVNIGYYTGYLDHATADRIMELFDTEHPMFGKSHPTQAEALAIGIAWGKRSKEKEGKLF